MKSVVDRKDKNVNIGGVQRSLFCQQVQVGINDTTPSPIDRGGIKGGVQHKKSAFTLAEVLITIGIIGVVAAMTLPALIHSYRKKVVETKLKKFYSVMSQATTKSIMENGPMENWDDFSSSNNGDEVQKWFDKYFKPYIKTVKEYQSDDGESLYVVFGDGSIANFTNWASTTSHTSYNYNGLVHVFFLTDAKALIKKTYCVNGFSFLFYNTRDKKYYFQPYTWGLTDAQANDRDYIISQGRSQFCTKLLMLDNWEIKKDTPGW